MSLRVRMGLVAGLAVAIAVIAVAITAYAGTRSELRGQLDSSLQGLTGSVLSRTGIPANGHPTRAGAKAPVPPSDATTNTEKRAMRLTSIWMLIYKVSW